VREENDTLRRTVSATLYKNIVREKAANSNLTHGVYGTKK